MTRKHTKEEAEVSRARKLAYCSEWHRKHRRQAQESKKQYRYRQKRLAFAALGGRCAHCPESDPEVLAIDHVNDDGALERKAKNHCAMYNRIIRGESPGRYQLLCFNCNWRKELRRRQIAYDQTE
jgi:hypothetical protein